MSLALFPFPGFTLLFVHKIFDNSISIWASFASNKFNRILCCSDLHQIISNPRAIDILRDLRVPRKRDLGSNANTINFRAMRVLFRSTLVDHIIITIVIAICEVNRLLLLGTKPKTNL